MYCRGDSLFIAMHNVSLDFIVGEVTGCQVAEIYVMDRYKNMLQNDDNCNNPMLCCIRRAQNQSSLTKFTPPPPKKIIWESLQNMCSLV